MEILHREHGISIATKTILEQWKKQALRKTCMALQLVIDSNIKHPLGLLEHVIVASCGIDYKHTFVMVDFGQYSRHEVILG